MSFRNSLVVFTLVLLALPVVKAGLPGTFLSIDPEVMYIGNALMYTAVGQIQYIDHPGTPSIVFLHFAYFPIRLIAKFIWHVPFLDWSYTNLSVLFFYSRLFQTLILGFSLYVFLLSVQKITSSKLTLLLAWLALLSFSHFPYLGISVSPETTSFFLISVWVYLLSGYLTHQNPLVISALSFISGFALGNKFTNFALIYPYSIGLRR